jgi:site-specific recombinase XerD
MLRVTINGKSAKTALGVRVIPDYWDVSKSRCRLRDHSEGRKINIFIENTLSKCNRAYTTLCDEYDVVTADMVINSILGRAEGKHQGVVEIFQKQVDELERCIGQGNSYTHFQKNRTAMNNLKQYLQSHCNCSDVPITRFTHDHVLGVFAFLKAEKGQAHNTAIKSMTLLKKVTLRSLHSGWITRDPFMGFSLGYKPVDRPYLEQAEIERIMDIRPIQKHVEFVRDLFLFSCYTGLAYADVKKLKASEIVKTPDGNEWIKTKRMKTKTKASIPLLPIPTYIISKYAKLDELAPDDLVFKVYSNQKVNDYLKIVAKQARIGKVVTFHVARHTFATTVTLQNGIPIETVSKMLGHTKLTTTQHYARVLDSKIGKDMEKLKKLYLRIA